MRNKRAAEIAAGLNSQARSDGKLRRPKIIEGVKVCVSGEPMNVRGHIWHTLVPNDEADERVWEWSETDGRIIKTYPS